MIHPDEVAASTRVKPASSGPQTLIRPSGNILEGIKIASPCHASWEHMEGNDRVRFCGDCHLNVYNLSDMDRADAEMLVAQSEGRVCVRFYSRADGTVLTRDCPVGLRAIRMRMAMGLAFAVGMLISLWMMVFRSSQTDSGQGIRPPIPRPVQKVLHRVTPPAVAGGVKSVPARAIPVHSSYPEPEAMPPVARDGPTPAGLLPPEMCRQQRKHSSSQELRVTMGSPA